MAKILVVDDDKSIVELLRHLLSRDGNTVCVAYDGRAGLSAARTEKPDMIILDVMMPEIDGITVSGILFQDPAMRLIPVLILTAKGSARGMLELLPNVRLYMDKPFDPPELIKNVQRLLAVPPRASAVNSNVNPHA
jgi:two-component system alkaline phosphatase synthesis response regulator PhoP